MHVCDTDVHRRLFAATPNSISIRSRIESINQIDRINFRQLARSRDSCTNCIAFIQSSHSVLLNEPLPRSPVSSLPIPGTQFNTELLSK